MHTLNELKDRLLPDLKELAEQLNVGNFKRLSKQDLIYKILDQQATQPGPEAAAEAVTEAAPAVTPKPARAPPRCCRGPRRGPHQSPRCVRSSRAALLRRGPARCGGSLRRAGSPNPSRCRSCPRG
ncbi:Rho termination factor N-terminal domain-containing protein [Hymenobacter coccineus]|uniref:Rho termination factor N-terminal domain-containing protein n=1 Tax=Hymenobacter coccineus TaxID=1908235 RepID=UPI000B8E7478|nr:Rho termination factor N-terminal domain-containing protein [Hymenobacter coccineus]